VFSAAERSQRPRIVNITITTSMTTCEPIAATSATTCTYQMPVAVMIA